MKETMTCCLVAVAAITAAPFSRASADTFCIGGAIFTCLDDPFDCALPGVYVTVEQIDGPFAREEMTGDYGIWVMCDVPEGTYTVMPTLDGYCFIQVLAGPTLGDRPPIIIFVDEAHEVPNENIKFLAEESSELCAVSSYHEHDGFHCLLDLTTNNIEPRGCGIQTLNVTFPEDLSGASVDASVQCWDEDYTGSMTVGPPVGSLVTLHFDPQLPDQTCCRITFSGDASGSVEVRSLIGDINRNNLVEIGDRESVKNQICRPITCQNLTKDQNCNGIIEVGDMDSITNKIGHTAPDCP